MTETPLPLDDTDRRVINRLQDGFPLTDEPYREVATELGLKEGDLIARLQRLLADGVLTRFGPLFQIERVGGRFLLAALQVPEADYPRVTALVNALPAVAHNYRREHAFNMWFVLATENTTDLELALATLEQSTGLPVFTFPKEREYFVELKLRA